MAGNSNAAAPGAEEQQEKQDVKLELLERVWLLRSPDGPDVDKPAVLAALQATIFGHDLAPAYVHVCAALGLPVDEARLAAMRTANAAKLATLDAAVADAEENLGESEVREALLAKADYLATIGDKPAAFAAYAVTEGKSAGSGPKMDIAFSCARLCMFHGDWHGVKEQLAKAQRLCDSGGDWERKNKLKVYQGVLAMYARDFKAAAALFHEALATFSAMELFPYERVVFYAVVTSVIALDRVALKAKVVDAPEVLTSIGQTPALAQYLNSLYGCQYKPFFQVRGGTRMAQQHPRQAHGAAPGRLRACAACMRTRTPAAAAAEPPHAHTRAPAPQACSLACPHTQPRRRRSWRWWTRSSGTPTCPRTRGTTCGRCVPRTHARPPMASPRAGSVAHTAARVLGKRAGHGCTHEAPSLPHEVRAVAGTPPALHFAPHARASIHTPGPPSRRCASWRTASSWSPTSRWRWRPWRPRSA